MLGPPVTHAILEEYGTGQMDPEMKELKIGLQHRGVHVEFAPIKRLFRRELALSRSTLVAGSIPFVRSAFLQLGIQPPVLNEYPNCLAEFLHRRMWTLTQGQLYKYFDEAGRKPCFAKPETRRKRFTGRVFSCAEDLIHADGASCSMSLVCADVVEWLTEYRVFVLHGHTLGIRHYRGDSTLALDFNVVRRAIEIFENSGTACISYAADFGVLASGITALVEVNDAWGLGSWGLDENAYTDLIIARWREIAASGGW
jgi:hypothetical protein